MANGDSLHIRDARQTDAQAIVDIYNPFIENTIITFEYDLIDGAEIANRIERVTTANFPWLVAELNGQIVAYAYAGTWRNRAAFLHSVESAIYVDPAFAGRGIGKRLYGQLFDVLREQNFHTVIAGITMPNEASQKLHAKFGFEQVGLYKSVGYKFDKWIDVEFWQLML